MAKKQYESQIGAQVTAFTGRTTVPAIPAEDLANHEERITESVEEPVVQTKVITEQATENNVDASTNFIKLHLNKPKQKKKYISLYLPEEMLNELKNIAERHNSSTNQIIVQILEQSMSHLAN